MSPHGFMQTCRRAVVIPVLLIAAAAAPAQDAVQAYPKNYRMIFQNSAVDVIRAHYGPHEKVGVHNHSSYPTVYVYLSDSGPVRFQHSEAKPFTLIRKPVHAGSYRVTPGRLERHSVENLGSSSSDFLRVELKQVPLGGVTPFRGAAPRTLTANSAATEYTSGAVTIQRIVCAGASTCLVPGERSPSLLVPYTSMVAMATDGAGKREVHTGRVEWLPAGTSLTVAPTSAGSVDMLRILFAARQ